MRGSWFKKAIVPILVVGAVGAMLLTNLPKQDAIEDGGKNTDIALAQKNNTDGAKEEVIYLEFEPVAVEVLEEGQPEENWERIESIQLTSMATGAVLHLYRDSSEDTEDWKSGQICGFIEHQNKLYALDNISAYGRESLEAKLVDRTGDGKDELEIVGGMGATYVQMKIIAYDGEKNLWLNRLTMGSPQIVDLDGDGKEELMAISTGSLPSFVDIYRWNGSSFEKVDIGKATDNQYVRLYNTGYTAENNYKEDGDWLIEVGKWINHRVENIQNYRYEDGKLVK